MRASTLFDSVSSPDARPTSPACVTSPEVPMSDTSTAEPTVELRIPMILRPHVGGASKVTASGSTLGRVLADLTSRFPGIGGQIITADGELHKFVNIYVNDDDARYLGKLDAPIKAGDDVTILPAVAGGSV
jgi:sulfur-carrier protein